MVKCRTCGGTYEPTLPDGTQYFHACPPLSARELKDELRANRATIPRAVRARLDEAAAADRADPMPEGQPSRVDQVLTTVVVERPNRRDENIRPGLDAREKGSRIKAEGAGVDELPAP